MTLTLLPLLPIAGSGLLAAALLWALVRQTARRRRDRAAVFDAAARAFTDVRISLAPDGFARLTGRRCGRPFELRVMPDSLTMRKLPALWLLVTLTAPQPLPGHLSVMRRPQGGEGFSPFARLAHSLPAPAGAPEDAVARADHPGAAEEDFGPAIATLGDDRAKEFLAGPSGLRFVWLAEEADRTRYLIFREAELGAAPVAEALAAALADRLIAVEAAVAAGRVAPVAGNVVALRRSA